MRVFPFLFFFLAAPDDKTHTVSCKQGFELTANGDSTPTKVKNSPSQEDNDAFLTIRSNKVTTNDNKLFQSKNTARQLWESISTAPTTVLFMPLQVHVFPVRPHIEGDTRCGCQHIVQLQKPDSKTTKFTVYIYTHATVQKLGSLTNFCIEMNPIISSFAK